MHADSLVKEAEASEPHAAAAAPAPPGEAAGRSFREDLRIASATSGDLETGSSVERPRAEPPEQAEPYALSTVAAHPAWSAPASPEHAGDAGTAGPPRPPHPPDVHESTAWPTAAAQARGAPRQHESSAEPSAGTTGPTSRPRSSEAGESIGNHDGRSCAFQSGFLGSWCEGTVRDTGCASEPQLRCGVGDTVPMVAAVSDAVEALVRRFAQRLPRRRIARMLDVMLTTLSACGGGDAAEGPSGAPLRNTLLRDVH